MGAWTTRIFDDDGAADIKAEYRILLGYGMAPEEAYRKIEEYFYPQYKEADDEDVYWLSVALFQWQNGLLQDHVKQRALQCIEEESYLERWKESGETVYRKRKETLEKLRDNLLNVENPTKTKFPKCPKYYRTKTGYEVGDLLAYRILTEPILGKRDSEWAERTAQAKKMLWKKYVLLRVVEVSKRPVTMLWPEIDYMSSASVMLYDWHGDEIPAMAEIGKMPFRPIVFDYLPRSGWRKRLVSGIILDNYDKKKEAGNCEITVLGNDACFKEEMPKMIREHPGCPIQVPINFNLRLAMTYALREDDETSWMYENKYRNELVNFEREANE